MGRLSSLIEALGLVAVVAGAALFDWRAGLIVLGLVLLLVGIVLDPPRRSV
jgi:hypothetical protein